jgi:hypothetical protein
MKENSRVSKSMRGRKREDERQEPRTRSKKKEEKKKWRRLRWWGEVVSRGRKERKWETGTKSMSHEERGEKEMKENKRWPRFSVEEKIEEKKTKKKKMSKTTKELGNGKRTSWIATSGNWELGRGLKAGCHFTWCQPFKKKS